MTMAERQILMTDADLLDAIQALEGQEPTDEVKDLLKMMSDNRIISWEEAEQIMHCNSPIKSSLPPQTRPMEPDNDTDVDWSIRQLQMDDPKLKQVNLNNMKRTPIPQVKRLLAAIKNNTHLEKIALANMGLYDNDCEPIFDVVSNNTTLKSINLETNYLSGDFFARLFKAALVNQALEEVKAVNQGVTFATAAEKEIIDAVFQNKGLTKVSINIRLPEGRHKIENALIRNQEIRRILRRQAAVRAREVEQAQKTAEKVNGSIAAIGEIQSGKAQLMKPAAVLESASQVPPPSSHTVDGDESTSNSGKIPLATVGSAMKTSDTHGKMNGGEKHVNKMSDVANRMVTNKTSNQSYHSNDSTKITATKKTENKVTATTTTTANATDGQVKSKETPLKKVSVEQAVLEEELDTEELLRKASLPKKFSLPPTESFTSSKSDKTITDTSSAAFAAVSRSQNNFRKNSLKNNCTVSEKETCSAASIGTNNQCCNYKPIRMTNSTRKSLIPPIFLNSDQQNEPVKRNFQISSRKNSSSEQGKKVASKLDDLQKPSFHSNPFHSPMPVYSLERTNHS